MDWRRGICGAALLLACVMVAGCGGDDEKDKKPKMESIPASPIRPSPAKVLRKPLIPKCATKGYKQRLAPVPGQHKTAWQVNYQLPSTFKKPPPPGSTSLVLIVETAPATKSGSLGKGSYYVNVAGRRVNVQEMKGSTRWTATWRTGAAFYTALATGDRFSGLAKFIACLP
jgi:hypothetical protein